MTRLLPFCYAKSVQQNPRKRTLHLKLALIIFVGISIPTISAFITQNTLISILSGFISLALTIFAVFFVLKPLQSLLKGVESLGAGNVNFRLDIKSNDEFEDVGYSFNLMADKIAHIFQKLESDKNTLGMERNMLDVVLSSMIDGVIALDMSKNIVFVNKAAEYLTGYPKEEIQGKPVDATFHIFSDQEEITSKAYCQEGYNKTLLFVGKDGRQKRINLLTTSTPKEGFQTNLNCILILQDLSKEEELEQMKFDFVSMASHELKTPLTTIIGYLSVFIDENRDKIGNEALLLLERSLISARTLQGLVENLLSVNKIEKEKFTVMIEAVDYTNILNKVIYELQNQAKLKNITLSLAPPPQNLPRVLLDQIRIIEVLNNLIGNAIKYTNSGGKISVSLAVTPTEVITTIADTGIGIPEEALPHLFSKFYRVSNKLQKAQKGTGLGLYIAKAIIEKLNGKIWVESKVGEGSRFNFSLPIATQGILGNIDTQGITKEAIQTGALNY